jgi:hypothetical protein
LAQLQVAASVEGQLAEARAKVAAMEAARQQQEAEADSIREKIRNLLIRRYGTGNVTYHLLTWAWPTEPCSCASCMLPGDVCVASVLVVVLL